MAYTLIKTFNGAVRTCMLLKHLWIQPPVIWCWEMSGMFLESAACYDAAMYVNTAKCNDGGGVSVWGWTSIMYVNTAMCNNGEGGMQVWGWIKLKQLNALCRQSRGLNVLAKTKVFNVFIRANLNYCPLVWINRNITDLARLEKVQGAVQLIFNDKMSTYIDLFRRAGVPSVLIRWQWLLAIEVYKTSMVYLHYIYKISLMRKNYHTI